jgi:cytochrome c oxidase subunit 2
LANVERRDLIKIIIAGICIIGGGLLIGQAYRFALPTPASTQAIAHDELSVGIASVAGVIFLLVEGLLVYALLNFRARPGDESDALPIRGNTRLEVAWTIIPLLIVTGISFVSFNVLKEVDFNYSILGRWFHGPVTPGEILSEPVTGGDILVEVTGRQFSWGYQYPTFGIKSSELHVPLNKLILLRLTSLDVIHSFWIPDLRLKKDANPGYWNEMRFTPNKLGTYLIECTELCGLGHAEMRSSLVVQTEEDFQAWVQQMLQGGQATDPNQAARTILTQQGCGTCHTLKDANLNGKIGPSLDGLGAVAGSRVPGMGAAEYIRQSILDPKAYIVPGYMDVMPTFKDRITGAELDLLVNYLLKQ